MTTRIRVAFIVALGLLVTGTTVQAAPREVVFGFMSKVGGAWQLARSSNLISKQSVRPNTDTALGIVIRGEGPEAFTYKKVFIDSRGHVTASEETEVQPNRAGEWQLTSTAYLDNSDPVGDWTLEVHINGTVFTRIKFTVVD